jgi:hypothetical protein
MNQSWLGMTWDYQRDKDLTKPYQSALWAGSPWMDMMHEIHKTRYGDI